MELERKFAVWNSSRGKLYCEILSVNLTLCYRAAQQIIVYVN